MQDKTYERRRKLFAVVSIVLFAALMTLLTVTVGRKLVTLAAEPEQFRIWVENTGIWGKAMMVGVSAFQIIVAVIPGEPFEIAAGYAFGGLQGTLLYYAGVLIGQTVVFLFTKKVGAKVVEVFVTREKLMQFKFLQNSKRLYSTLFFLFLIPGTPKDVLAYVAGLTPAKLLPFLLLTGVARLPSVLTSTLGGHLLGSKQYETAIWVFVATAVLSLACWLLYRQREKRLEQKAAAQDTSPSDKAPEGPRHSA